MKKTELLQKLQQEISDEEHQLLLENRISHISQYVTFYCRRVFLSNERKNEWLRMFLLRMSFCFAKRRKEQQPFRRIRLYRKCNKF